MPVTKSAKRALRGSTKKSVVNKIIVSRMDAAIRSAKKLKTKELVVKATSLVDRAAKKSVIHRNKASRLKSQIAKIS